MVSVPSPVVALALSEASSAGTVGSDEVVVVVVSVVPVSGDEVSVSVVLVSVVMSDVVVEVVSGVVVGVGLVVAVLPPPPLSLSFGGGVLFVVLFVV